MVLMQAERKEQAPYSSWKTANDVKKLVVSKEIIGHGGNFGLVRSGRVTFNDGTSSRVAVKGFVDGISEDAVRKYEEAIEKLANAGVKIPKIGFIQYQQKWVQISSLFGRRDRNRKLFHYPPRLENENQFLQDLAEQASIIHKAGFQFVEDSIKWYNTEDGPKPIIVDVDLYARQHALQYPPSVRSSALAVMECVPWELKDKALKAFLDKIGDIAPEAKKKMMQEMNHA